MPKRIVIDIETVPRPGIMDTWYPQWASDKYPNVEGDALEDQAALHAEFGLVCAVAIASANGNDEPVVHTASNEDEEVELLAAIENLMDDENVILVGHNIKGFDIPFLAKRFMARRGFVPRMLNMGGKKPWEIPHRDTMEIMRFGGGASMSLRSACLMLGIEDPKGSVRGLEVPEMFRQGRVLEIGQYCAGDVVAERKLYKKLIDAEVV